MARFKKDYNSYFISVTQLLCSIATLSMIIGFAVILGGGTNSAFTTGTVFLIISGLLVLAYFIMSCISINQTS